MTLNLAILGDFTYLDTDGTVYQDRGKQKIRLYNYNRTWRL